jgi:hypothetical protein
MIGMIRWVFLTLLFGVISCADHQAEWLSEEGASHEVHTQSEARLKIISDAVVRTDRTLGHCHENAPCGAGKVCIENACSDPCGLANPCRFGQTCHETGLCLSPPNTCLGHRCLRDCIDEFDCPVDEFCTDAGQCAAEQDEGAKMDDSSNSVFLAVNRRNLEGFDNSSSDKGVPMHAGTLQRPVHEIGADAEHRCEAGLAWDDKAETCLEMGCQNLAEIAPNVLYKMPTQKQNHFSLTCNRDSGVEAMLGFGTALRFRMVEDGRVSIDLMGPGFVYIASDCGHHPNVKTCGKGRALKDVPIPAGDYTLIIERELGTTADLSVMLRVH